MALMVMMNELTNALDNGDHVIGTFLDFSKAFDTVNHSILLDKLYHYGIRDNALEWFSSYLTGRKQFVTYNGISSGQKTVKCGVPQGSILGPLLFLLYINDLYHVCNNSIPILFADDTNLFFSGSDPKELESEINTELDHISTRGVTIRLATIRYISRYTTHDMVHDTIQNQLIYYQWKILKHCGMCHQYCYIKTVILARNSEFKIN